MCLYKEKGKLWKTIATFFYKRSGNDIKNRFYSTLRRVARKEGENVKILLPKAKLLAYVDKAISSSHLCYSKRGRKRLPIEDEAYVLKPDEQVEEKSKKESEEEFSLNSQKKKFKEELVKNEKKIEDDYIQLVHHIVEAPSNLINNYKADLNEVLKEQEKLHGIYKNLLGKLKSNINEWIKQQPK